MSSDIQLPIRVDWTPPPFSQLNFTPSADRCKLATIWYSEVAKSVSAHWIAQTTSNSSVEYLNSTLPDGYDGFQTFTYAETLMALISWYVDLQFASSGTAEAQVGNALLAMPYRRCGQAICDKLDWEGDPDISGVGVSIFVF